MRRVKCLLQAARARRRIITLTGLVVLLLGFGRPAMAADAAEQATVDGAGPVLEVWVEDGLLTLDARDAPLAEVLEEIAAAADFRLVTKDRLDIPVTRSFAGMPVDQGVARLLGRMSSIALYAPAPDGRGSVLTEVRLLRGPAEDAPGTVQAEADGLDEPPPAPELALEGTDPRLDRLRALVGTPSAAAARELSAAVAGDEDPAARRIAVVGLGSLGAKTVGPGRERARMALEEALSDEDDLVRQRAVQGLARIAGKDALEPLRRVLFEDPAPAVRRMAAVRLGRMSDEVAVLALTAAQSDSDPAVRDAAASALARLQGTGPGQPD